MSQAKRNRNRSVRQQARRQRALDRFEIKAKNRHITDEEYQQYVARKQVERSALQRRLGGSE